MLVVSFEGCDNIGKSTIIDRLKHLYKNNYNVFTLSSSAPPKGIINTEKYQFKIFTQRSKMINAIFSINDNIKQDTIVLLDRFCYDEGVYGKLYRFASNKYVSKLCKKCYHFIKGGNLDIKVGVIRLVAGSDLILNNDDNNSFTSKISNIEERKKQIVLEQKLFNETLKNCIKNKSLDFYFTINVESTFGSKFRDINDIITDIIDKLSSVYYLSSENKNNNNNE
jgi:hypothetical protein